MENYIETEPGICLSYRESGQGRQTVLMPLAAFTADFEILARGRRVIRYDPRGRGKSSAIEVEQASFENDLADLDAVRDRLGLERVALIGWSYYAGVVARYAMVHPQHVERLVTVGGMPLCGAGWTSALQESAARMSALPADVKQRQEEAQRSGDRLALWRSMMEVFRHTRMGRDPVRPLPENLDQYPNERMAYVIPRVTRNLESMGDWDWRADAAKLPVPALIVEGDADLCPESAREWAATLPNAKLFWMDGVGHFPMYEDPERFFAAIEEFLSEGSGPSR